jgi:nitroimidazol reductase NimA-like FMN-containing flavoprotein (pyridoxamine 5'-phosphate oxidase superfamily)
MQVDDRAVRDFLRRSMVARIATLSRTGRPSVTPLYFVYLNSHVWLGTVDWTLAARDVRADPRVSVLFTGEQNPHDHRVLRVTGRASMRTDRQAQRSYVLRVAFKYSLTPGQIRNTLAHTRQLLLRRRYHIQSAQKGQSCVIEVTPEQAEFLNDNQPR